ncbi:hypothetical protein [Desulfotruncus arcticus]|uniref:hypothetical protein n=1 Tax=Desulfotruncus arcticus TaxID=341036 RepID=UPI0013F4DDCC|nr:hypothetical protein [Desulfotruncus arcticus]
MTGVGLLSGFGVPDQPPEYNLDRSEQETKRDTDLDKIMELEEIESGKRHSKSFID